MDKFDASAQLFAHVTADHRLVVWDTVTGTLKSEYASPQHLKQAISAVAWGSCATSAATKRKRKDSAAAAVDAHVVALGMRAGSIVLYSVSRGEVLKQLEGYEHLFDFVASR